MKTHSARILVVVSLGLVLAVSSQGAPQKKKKKAAAEEAATPEKVAPAPAPAPAPSKEKAAEPAAQAREPIAAEKDPAREKWRIEVAPYAILGSGRPGKGASDFDKPDGVAFTPEGLLLATDAKNRRVQVWDVKTKTHLGEFGHGVFGGEIVDIAVAPSGMVLVTDQTLNLAYALMPAAPAKGAKAKGASAVEYQLKGTRFGEQGFDKLGGIAIDSRGRIYAVDAHLNDVRRFNPDGTVDATWKFEKKRPNGDTYLHGCEGIAIDEATGNLFIASEKDSLIQVFDRETGAYRGKVLGAALDGSGTHVFSGSVEGLALAGKYLFAVDESVGHIQVFDLSRPGVFNSDLAGFRRNGGYLGFFGHSPMVDFEDKNNKTLQQQVKVGAVIPGQANPPGYFCSPDSIAAYVDKEGGDTYIAIADQCNYRLAVYRWSEIEAALSSKAAPAPAPAPEAAPGKGGKKKGKGGR